ncbi:hypothetical protein AMAG_10637 [Allomyces macrogynus ATCC 38327]|uniref:Ubiquitin-like domain-containing protein n=1 Tax=Allomyces macrogynus (strain ATCC 38327) TaxID=578462 RepID=A0A0L0SR53_ALLM3|nr:hypothetical protein AMAG_10637 [Allomyces macrogynus ATCC 38327]|eukprot:KNE64971.1 hypothetical protein AMAG_10637 [Allomyces macrogynus ATCC 38327]
MDGALRFVEHELDLHAVAAHLRQFLHMRPYRRFLVLKLARHDGDNLLLGPSAVIDAVWRTHVLDTRAYRAMTARLPFAIEYTPAAAQDEDDAMRARKLENTRACYRARWGAEPPVSMWGGAAERLILLPRVATPNGMQGRARRRKRNDEGDMDDPLTLHIKTLEKITLKVRVNRLETVADLKARIHGQHIGARPTQQRLIHQGRELRDERQLADYGLENKTDLHLITLQCGRE